MTKHPYAKLVKYPSSEILDYTIEELVNDSDDISFYLPYQWSKGDGIGNRRPKDPLTIYWSAHVNGLEDRVTYKTTLGALLDDTFEVHEIWHEKPPAIGSKDVPIFVGIRDALQKEIDRLNVWINNAKPEEKDNG